MQRSLKYPLEAKTNCVGVRCVRKGGPRGSEGRAALLSTLLNYVHRSRADFRRWLRLSEHLALHPRGYDPSTESPRPTDVRFAPLSGRSEDLARLAVYHC
jgi:hypothetical protein